MLSARPDLLIMNKLRASHGRYTVAMGTAVGPHWRHTPHRCKLRWQGQTDDTVWLSHFASKYVNRVQVAVQGLLNYVNPSVRVAIFPIFKKNPAAILIKRKHWKFVISVFGSSSTFRSILVSLWATVKKQIDRKVDRFCDFCQFKKIPASTLIITEY